MTEGKWEQLSLFTDEELGIVHLTKIYTKTGDKGTTAIANNKRVKKDSPIVIAIGKVDTANSAIGMCKPDATLSVVQNDLFNLGADLAGSETIKITQENIDWLEKAIDDVNQYLQPLNSFVLPTGPVHFARSLVREAEIILWWAMEYEEDINPLLVVYLNRLSDLLFVLARRHNDGSEVLWIPKV